MIKFILPLLFSTCLVAAEWGTSLSVRTPNDEVSPLDYEISIKLHDTDGKFQYLLKIEEFADQLWRIFF